MIPVYARNLWPNYEAAIQRISGLSRLRQMVGLRPDSDITHRQWLAIESRLKFAEIQLIEELKSAGRRYLPHANKNIHAARYIQHHIGQMEVSLTRAYSFFDNYLDVLTQRHMPELGPLLQGCDVLALDAVLKHHPALNIIEPPLVSVNRGFGASVARQDIRMPGGNSNPLALIEIPYTRLLEKYNLTSIIHESGHEVMVRLGLIETLPIMVRSGLRQQGASKDLQEYFALWMSEIGPDLWTFLCSGIAAAGGIREILSLPPSLMYRISWTDPHPPAWLRVLLNFEWCRQIWGSGIWDDWEKEWLAIYPLSLAPQESLMLMEEGQKMLNTVARSLLFTRFKTLTGKSISSLFDLQSLAPAILESRIVKGRIDLRGLRPCAQLAVFRLMKAKNSLSPEKLDKIMGDWLKRLKNFKTD